VCGAGSRDEQEKSEEADLKSGKPAQAKRETFFRATMVGTGKALVAQAKGSEMQLSMKRAKLKKLASVLRLLDACWELAVGMDDEGSERRQSMLIHEYVNWAGAVLTIRVDEEQLPPLEELVFTLQVSVLTALGVSSHHWVWVFGTRCFFFSAVLRIGVSDSGEAAALAAERFLHGDCR
jgi:hypothetical protein